MARSTAREFPRISMPVLAPAISESSISTSESSRRIPVASGIFSSARMRRPVIRPLEIFSATIAIVGLVAEGTARMMAPSGTRLVIFTPLRSRICSLKCRCASSTKLPWSRPRMLVRTEIWRWFSRRAMIVAPLTTRISASCESGTRPPSCVGTRMFPIAEASLRAPGA